MQSALKKKILKITEDQTLAVKLLHILKFITNLSMPNLKYVYAYACKYDRF